MRNMSYTHTAEDNQSGLDKALAAPGRALRELLCEILPYGQGGSATDSVASSPDAIDMFLRADGRLARLLYASTINYVLRRLINVAFYFDRQAAEYMQDRSFMVNQLRLFLSTHTTLSDRSTERATGLLVQVVRVASRDVPRNYKEAVRRKAVDAGKRCYICGCGLTLNKGARSDAVVEHVWPRAMGGGNAPENLRVSCADCSEKKKDYIDASDFHYEMIALKSTGPDDRSFWTDLCSVHRIAIWLNGDCRCAHCGKLAEDVGELAFRRKTADDSWHFLNIEPICSSDSNQERLA